MEFVKNQLNKQDGTQHQKTKLAMPGFLRSNHNAKEFLQLRAGKKIGTMDNVLISKDMQVEIVGAEFSVFLRPEVNQKLLDEASMMVSKESGNDSTNNSVFSETGYNDEDDGEKKEKVEEKQDEMMVSDAVST